MKKLFTAIQKNDFETVRNLLLKNPELISSTLKGTPKKYDSQSPLQVALKASNTELIKLLLTFKPDVNYIEDETCINPWRAPVIHDAINRAIMYSRWNVNRQEGLEVFNSKIKADEAFDLLKIIVEMGADVNAKDSYGNACIDRACLQARQILPTNNQQDRILTEELRSDISRIFNLLIENGADMNYIAPNAFGLTYKERYKDEAIINFI
ncbi:MAG: ankyrin repeat domain-containing protein [Ruminococcaceae bacterium]|nr:ankyrin repeat domain-containing protein [Oscillospiraceae bacterium]